MSPLFARLKRSECGAAAVEFALVGMVAIVTFLGIIEFGRSLYMRNEMSYAVDRAARKILTNPGVPDAEVEAVVREAFAFGSSTDLQVSFGLETVDGVSFRTLLVTYPVTLLIPNLTNASFTLKINRRVPLT